MFGKSTDKVQTSKSNFDNILGAVKVSRIPKPNVGIFVFILSIGLGLAGMYYSRTYIENKVDFYKTQLEKTEEMVDVVVPGRRLLQGESIRQSDLLIRPIPVAYVDSNSILQSNFTDALGQQLAFDVDEGKPLLWAHLEGGRSRTFSGLVPEGARALTVRVDEINSISGFLQPGDRIDLLMTHGLGADNSVFPLIQNLNVIATGLQTRVDKNSVGGGKRSFTTITVNVSPDNAQKITLAQKMGKLTAVLRNPEDLEPVSQQPMTAAGLFNKKKPKRKASVKKQTPKAPAIEYIVGGA